MKIEFDLLSNAIDSIQQAIELLAWRDVSEDARRLKQAVQVVAHGVELLLKERLRRIHPVLVWENVDKFPSLSARTVTVDIALCRLSKIGNLSILEEERELISSLRDTRNAIEHYSWSTTKHEADRIVGQALGFAIHFAKVELQYDFFGYHMRKDDTLDQLLETNPELAKYFQERYERRLHGVSGSRGECGYCHALTVNPSTGACELCGHWNDLSWSEELPF